MKPALPPRALWVWGESRDLLRGASGAGGRDGETNAQRTFFAFLAAPHGRPDRAITTLYLGGIPLSALAPAAAGPVRGFLTVAHRHGLSVDFLCGDPGWARERQHDNALAYLRAVLAYNRSAPAGGRFNGFQYDVEPYLLKEWPAPILRRDFLRLLDRARAEIEAAATTSGPKLVFGAAIPAWFDQEPFGFLDRAVLDRVDYLALMDYVHAADPLIARAENEIAYAGKVGKRVVIGVETQRLTTEPTATFFAEGDAAMERALSAAARRYQSARGFGGFAVHHLGSYRTFTP